jgi:glucosamine--fructose-6-phosphate aminotransferase (isomerizing)
MLRTHMSREINEIPDVIRRFLSDMAPQLQETAAALRHRDPALLITVARGSSDHAATYFKYAVEMLAGIPVASVGPSIASVYGAKLKLPNSACIGISQSGQSPDIVAMAKSARDGGALAIALTNNTDSRLAAIADHTLALSTGPEQSVAATKTFVASIVAGLALLAEWQQDDALRQALAALPDACAEALALDWSPLADRVVRANSLYVLGRGPGFAIASEMALKFKETCAIHAESYSAAEVLHGPSALVEARFAVLALAVEDAARGQICGTATRLASQGADVFVTDAIPGTIELPIVRGLHPLVAPLIPIVSFYCFIEALARRRGLNPDTPAHLRKVTETV